MAVSANWDPKQSSLHRTVRKIGLGNVAISRVPGEQKDLNKQKVPLQQYSEFMVI